MRISDWSSDVCSSDLASVQIRAIQKYFGGTQVIRGVDIDIEDGQFAVLVGPSGCGKSTLLRMLAGLEQITQGEILINGRVVNDEIGRASCRERVCQYV